MIFLKNIRNMNAVSFICYIVFSGWSLSCEGLEVESQILQIHDPKNTTDKHDEEIRKISASCEYLDLKDVEFLEDGNILIKAYNTIMPPSKSSIIVHGESICFERSEDLKNKIFNSCFKILHDDEDFNILLNGTVLLKSQHKVLESNTYKLDNGTLLTCYTDEDYEFDPTVIEDTSEHITTISPVAEHITDANLVPRATKVENSVSVIAPITQLIKFCIIFSYFIRM